jgi:amidophosphoribosyltransferase
MSGAKEVHIRAACPPLLFGCKFINFSRSTSDLELIARRVIQKTHGDVTAGELREFADPDSAMHGELVENIRQELRFTTLRYHRLDDLEKSIGIDPCKLCTYCWNGEE